MVRASTYFAAIALLAGFAVDYSLGADIVWVHQQRGGGGNLDWEDDLWRELLEGAGHKIVDHAPFDDLDINPEGLDVLNAADLVIFSRETNSGDYNEPDEQEYWTEGIKAPMIVLTPFVLRNSRWDMVDTGGIQETNKDEGFGPLKALDPGHPIFAGVLDAADEAIVFDVDALGIDDSIDYLQAFDDDGALGNGVVLAIESAFEVPWIVYWEEGSEFYEGSVLGYTAGGPRLHYSVGSDDDPNTWGEKNTTELGDKILLNAINWMTGGAPSLPGDFDGSGALDAADIDDLTTQSASNTNPAEYDLNADALVNDGDVKVWIRDLYKSWVGDANLDGEFNSGDLVTVLASGKYEQDVASTWSSGDFDGNGRTNTSDLVAALSDGGYEAGPRAAVAAVPEPASISLTLLACLGLAVARRRRV